MVYKRYIKRDGKIYGPYYYHSSKKNGKVVSNYIGKSHPDKSNSKKSKKNSKKNHILKKRKLSSVTKRGEKKNFPFKTFLLVLIPLLLFLFFAVGYGGPTGQATLSVQNIGVLEGNLSGDLEFTLMQSELMPSNTTIIINSSGNEYSYSLNELLSESAEQVQGSYYLKGKSVAGSGSGYGVNATRFPSVSFVLGIYKVINETESSDEPDSGDLNDSNDSTRQIPIAPIINSTQDNETSESNQTEPKEANNQTDTNTTTQRTITGSFILDSILNFIPGITGRATTLDLVETVEGSITALDSFTYELAENYTAQIISSEHEVDLEIIENNVTVTTEYIGNETETFNVPLDSLGIPAEQGTLEVRFEYEEEELLKDSKEITLADGGTRGLPVEQP
ncbi:hypothetical protein GF378_01685, partial [Candidatus Pacearchaeota archaeon]|nr:hypothetical protein [Candidatus Pacearchaeota archaeon]